MFSKDGTTVAGMKLERGQLLKSYRNLREDLEYVENRSIKKYSLSVIKRKIDSLVKENRLKIEDTELGTLFTVVNYESYQGFDNYRVVNLEQRKNRERTGKEQGWNNNKNVKNVNKTLRRKKNYDTDSLYYKMAKYFYQLILNNNPDHREPNLQNWADDFRKLVELDKRNKDQVREVMEWVQNDDFEHTVVLSPGKFRKRYDQLLLKTRREAGRVEQKSSSPSLRLVSEEEAIF